MIFLNSFESIVSLFFVASVKKMRERTTDLKDIHNPMVEKIKNYK
jgi:hypothetical protein